MGTKVKNYFTGHFSMKGLNEDANNGRWTFQIEDNMALKDHYHSFCKSKVDVRSELNKEILKKMMLKHENLFKEQVYELHRLYHVQKNLMKELKKKELYIYSAHSKTNPHLKFTENHNPIASTVFQQEDNMKESETTSSNAKRSNKKLFDLQLPADEYIESDDAECTRVQKVLEMPSGQNHHLGENSNINLTFSSCEIPINERKFWKSDSPLQKKLKTHYFADLNEPSHKISDDTTTSDPLNFLGSITLHEEVQHQKLTGKSSSVYGLPSYFSQENLRTNISNIETGRRPQGWLSSDIKDGKHGSKLGIFPSSCHERSSMSGESQFQFMKTPDSPQILLSDHNKRQIWFKGSEVCDIDISEQWPSCFKNSDKNDHLKNIKGVDLNMTPENGFQDEESQIRQDILIHSKNGTSLGVLCYKSQLSCDYSSNGLFNCSQNTPCVKFEIGNKQQKNSQSFVQNLVEMNIKGQSQSRDIGKPSEEKKLGKIPIEGIQLKLSDTTREVNLRSHFRNFIDLNSTLEDCNQELVVKNTTDISLEVPVTSDMEKEINRGETLNIKNSETYALAQDYESDVQQKQLDVMAADIIVSLSSDFSKYQGQITHLDPSSDLDPLSWFSEIVSLQVINERTSKNDGYCALDTEDNFFEMMTLNLQEMKIDENILKNQREKVKDISSLLTRPRRGQARRWRQRRDFRKDILPGLASLSRHEITEDLQIINNLMKASGHSLQTRKNSAKNVGTCRTKVRNLVVLTSPVEVQDAERPPNNGLSLDSGNLKGWGKTIRRRQRSRFHMGNTSFP